MFRLQLLGPVQATCDDRLLALGGPKPKAVLAALAFHANAEVDTDQLITWVWGLEAEITRSSIYQYAAGLRATLACTDGQAVLEGLRPNYRLTVADPAAAIDWQRFCTLLQRATAARRVGDPDEVRALLEHALGLWRGDALADVGDALPEIRRTMTARRLAAAEELAEMELEHGEPGRVVDLLGDLCAQSPGREHGAAMLMRALHALGLRDEAMAVYRRTRTYVGTTLGLDPHSPLEREYRSVLEGQVPADRHRTLRSGLPRRAGHFLGRRAELEQVSQFLVRPPPGEQPPVAVICAVDGMAGIGKTELALHAAHVVGDQFRDGALFIDLLGYSPHSEPLDPGYALGRLLRQLGVPSARIPADVEDRALLYRATLASRNMLIILDNARTASQVRPLLPAAPECRVIITTRKRLTALDDAYPIRLDVLDLDLAGDLFVAVAGLDPASSDRDTISRIVSRCDRLPLAIRIVAARYRDNAWPSLCDLEAQLADEQERLALIDDGDRSVAAAFTVSYQSLPDAQQRAFRLLGLMPGVESTMDPYEAAALTGTTFSAARQLLAHLSGNGLLTQPAPDRYAFHDLLRAYAARVVALAEPERAQRAALTRLLDHYAHTATLAIGLYAPSHPRPDPPAAAAGVATPSLADAALAQAWLDTHQRNVIAAAVYAADHGWTAHTVHLARALFPYMVSRRPHADAVALYRAALRDTRETWDAPTQIQMLNCLAGIYFQQGRYDDALKCLHRAAQINRDAGDRLGEGRTLGNLGNVYEKLGRYVEAEEQHRMALRLFTELGDRVGEASALQNLGSVCWNTGRDNEALGYFQRALQVATAVGDRATVGSALASIATWYWRQGRYVEAIRHHENALAVQREIGDEYEEAETLNDLCRTLREAGRVGEALAGYDKALTLARRVGNRYQEGRAHEGLAQSYEVLGDVDRARQHWAQALGVFTDLGIPKAEEVRQRLGGVSGADRRGES